MRCFCAGAVCITLLAGCVVGCGVGAQPDREREATGVAEADAEEATAAVVEQIRVIAAGESSRLVATQPLTEAEWQQLTGLSGLEELVLEAGGLDDARAELVASLPSLKKLVARHSPLSDAGMATLAKGVSLQELNLPQAGCTASGIAAVAALPKLRSLRIGGPYLQGTAVCDAVVSLEKLRFLHLVEVEIGDAGLAVLEQRPDLWSLYLDRAGVSDEAWGRYFQACPNVHVHVDQAHHDRDPGGDREQHETRSPIAPGASVQQQ